MSVKTKLTLLSALVWAVSLASLNAQIRSDFILVPEGDEPHIEIDDSVRLHVATSSIEGTIYYGLFDSLGNAIIAPKPILVGWAAQQPRLNFNGDHVVVVWRSVSQFGDVIGGYLLDTAKDLISERMKYNDVVGDVSSYFPDVAFLNDSTYIVVWSGVGYSGTGLYRQFATTSGRLIGENVLLVDEPSVTSSRIGRLNKNGDFILVWQDDHLGEEEVFYQFFSSDGTPKDSSFQVSDEPAIGRVWVVSFAMTGSGFNVVWTTLPADSEGQQIYWRRFNEAGVPLDASERVNLQDFPKKHALLSADIACDLAGNCVIAWHQLQNLTYRIHAQRFLASGIRFAGNFGVSIWTPQFNQIFPNVALYNDKIYTTWDSYQDSTQTRHVTWANILDFNDPTLHVQSRDGILLDDPQLLQNYPNPFNPTTTIRFSLPQRTHLTLKVFNIIGKEVATLVDKQFQSGEYTILFDAKGLSSGVYIYRLQAGSYMQQRKMLLLQ